jgi:uncharacterized protein YqgC (DUF456 family)
MSNALMLIVAALAVAIGGFFVPLAPPLSWVWAAAVVALSFLAGVQWAVYTMTNDPAKLARLVAKYLPVDEINALVGNGKDAFSIAVAEAAKLLGKAGVILRE